MSEICATCLHMHNEHFQVTTYDLFIPENQRLQTRCGHVTPDGSRCRCQNYVAPIPDLETVHLPPREDE